MVVILVIVAVDGVVFVVFGVMVVPLVGKIVIVVVVISVNKMLPENTPVELGLMILLQDGSEYIAHEDVVTRLNQDFLSSTARLGLGG